MSSLDWLTAWKRLTYVAILSGWQLAVGVFAIWLAFAFIEFVQVDPEVQFANLKARIPAVSEDLRRYCGSDPASLEFSSKEIEDSHDVKIVRESAVDGLPSGQAIGARKGKKEGPAEDKKGKKEGPAEDGKDKKAVPNRCDPSQAINWKYDRGSLDQTLTGMFDFDKQSPKATAWALVNLGIGPDDGEVVFLEEQKLLEGWPFWMALGISALSVIAVLSTSVLLHIYLNSKLDRLSEFGMRIGFVLHDLRHSLERIRSIAEGDGSIDHLIRESSRLMEDGRVIADLRLEPLRRVDLNSLLSTAAEGVDVVMDCPDGLVVRVPPRCFGSAVTNLLNNAAEHGSSDECSNQIEISVRVRPKEGWFKRRRVAVIAVSDNGSGTELRIERSENVRQAIERLKLVRDTKRRRGLGLLSVLYTVQVCGGKFALLNREDGKNGSVAEIVLPVELRKPRHRI